MKISIINGHVMDPASGTDQAIDVHVAAGKIAAFGPAPDGFKPNRVIDASGCIVAPGLVDLGARLREPGAEHKANIASETRAAASGGITTLCCPPDTSPVIDTPAVAELIRTTADDAGFARVRPIAALTRHLNGEHLSEFATLKAAGCIAVSQLMKPVSNLQVLRRAYEYAANFDMPVFIHPLEPDLSAGGCAHEGAVSTRLGLPGIPEAAETMAVARDLILVEQTGVRAHFCRLSTERAVRLIARARFDGLPVTADVASHHLYLTEHDIWQFDSLCHVLPPLRSDRDRDGLRMGLQEECIGAICSDHQPHEPDAKQVPFPETEPGISALETLLPLTLRLVDDGVLTLMSALHRLTQGPGDIIGHGAGRLALDGPADICIFNRDREWVVLEDTLLSRGHNTPFMGWHMKGKVMHTLLAGRPVYAHQESNDA
jgi:dihydroorotase